MEAGRHAALRRSVHASRLLVLGPNRQELHLGCAGLVESATTNYTSANDLANALRRAAVAHGGKQPQ
jgi:hypothetical protein